MEKAIPKNIADISISLGCIGIGVWFLYESYKLPPNSSPSDIGPGIFPLLVSILLILCGILLIVSSIKKPKENGNITFYRIKNTLMFVIILIGYLFLMNIIGYYITTLVMVPLLLFATGIKNVKLILFILIIFLLIAFIGFDILLGVPLP